MNRINVHLKIGTLIGTLTYKKDEDSFIFEYNNNYRGLLYGELSIEKGDRSFKSNRLFDIFYIDNSHGRYEIVSTYNIKEPDSNKSQWEMINKFVTKENPNKGFYFEKL